MKQGYGVPLISGLLFLSASLGKDGKPTGSPTALAAQSQQTTVQFKSALLPAYADTLRSLLKVVGGTGTYQDFKLSAGSVITKLVVDSGDSEEYRKLYNFVRAAGLTTGDSGTRVFFDAAPVYALLIEGLGHPDETLRFGNMRLLLQYGKPYLLAARKAEILIALKRPMAGTSFNPTFHAELLALLPLTSEERTRLAFDRRLLSRKILARLGDSSAEERLIREFKNSADLSSKQSLAAELGYVGSWKCARALAEEFFAPLTRQIPGTSVSFQYYAVQAMARIYPDEPLFTDIFRNLEKTALGYLPNEKGIPGIRMKAKRVVKETDQYFREISAWLQKNLGVTPRHPIPEKPLLIGY